MAANPLRNSDLEAGVAEPSGSVGEGTDEASPGPVESDYEGWTQATAEDGSRYWYNEATRETKWSLSD